MKIAFLVHDYRRVEGHSRYVVELANRFARDHEVHVFASVIEDESNPAVRLHRVKAWKASTLAHVLSYGALAPRQLRRSFDIVHTQGWCGPKGNVVTAHIANRAWHRAVEKAGTAVSARARLGGRIFETLEDRLYRSMSSGQVIAVSERVARDLREHYGCRAPVTVIHHGVDLETFRPDAYPAERLAIRQRFGIDYDAPVFLFVGDPRKGFDRTAAAIAKLPRAQLIAVSRGAAPAPLPERVHWAGPTTQVEHYHAAADALVLPTPYDAFGMVASEAMASGLPVIVSREAGVAELIQHGANGLLLDDFSSVHELARKMESVGGAYGNGRLMGLAARRTMEAQSWDRVAEQTMTVYRRAANVQ